MKFGHLPSGIRRELRRRSPKAHRCAEAAVRIADEGGIQYPSKRREQAADDENSKFDFANLHPPRKARRGVAPDSKDAISDRSFEDQQLQDDKDDKCPNYRGIDACKAATTDRAIDKLLPDGLGRSKRETSGESISSTLKEEERSQSYEQRWNAEQSDKNSIQRADEDPAGERADKCQSTAEDRSQAEKHARPDSTDRTNRDVDFTRRDDECLPERHNRQHSCDLDNACKLPTDSQLPA